jgi:hypothetical protein
VGNGVTSVALQSGELGLGDVEEDGHVLRGDGHGNRDDAVVNTFVP